MAPDTKERILLEALDLFATKGFESTSTADIAARLGMTKGALYKHFANKQAIFASILQKMNADDTAHAQKFDLPLAEGAGGGADGEGGEGCESGVDAVGGERGEGEEAEVHVSLEQLCAFALAQFEYWTQDPFASRFRRMLAVEQHRSPEAQQRYQQYLAAGQLGYVEEVFEALGLPNARARALAFCGPLFLSYSLADGTENTDTIAENLRAHFAAFVENYAVTTNESE